MKVVYTSLNVYLQMYIETNFIHNCPFYYLLLALRVLLQTMNNSDPHLFYPIPYHNIMNNQSKQ